MKKYLLIYHKEDNDGVFSGALFYDYLLSTIKVDKNDIVLFGADYNNLESWAKNHSDIEELKNQYENIIMTDISFNEKYMKQLYDGYNNKFIWCDHHKPIIDASFKNKFDDCLGIRNTNKSAILCVYEYLYDAFNEVYSTINKKPVDNFPELLRILSGWDSWSYEREGYDFEYVRNVNKAVTVKYNLDFDKILELVKMIRETYSEANVSIIYFFEELIQELYKFGKQLNEYDDITMENIIKISGDCSWQVMFMDKDKGRPLYHKACAIFHQGATNSTMFKCLKNKGINHGLVFKHSSNGNWTMSMYNIDDNEWTHCGEFLKEKYGGGGHKGAAGCTFTQDQFIEILKKKQI